ncbi:MAG: LysM peptidoglycan-binding domain-containing protein, partial [Rhodocyclaceae bacterium]|nr:LysM peptidoglycan-binding domain-containing protein [Rhodocyclaceae bacterium]
MKRGSCTLALVLLAGCASTGPAPVSEPRTPTRIEAPRAAQPAADAGKLHVVRKGDTLYSIALENGLSPRDLAAWNNLDNSHRIVVGQTLRLTPPGASPAPTSAATPSPEGAEVRPVIGSGAVVARPLDSAPATGAVSPAPTFAPGSAEAVKRAPKGGKLPYSEANLARLKGEATP